MPENKVWKPHTPQNFGKEVCSENGTDSESRDGTVLSVHGASLIKPILSMKKAWIVEDNVWPWDFLNR
jgi:hypothetical protein